MSFRDKFSFLKKLDDFVFRGRTPNVIWRFVLLPATVFYTELVVRIACCNRFWGSGLLMIPLYSFVLGVLFTVLCSFGKKKVNRWSLVGVQVLLSAWACTQIIYHSFFGKYLILYSLGAGGADQIVGSGIMRNTIGAILGNWWAFPVLALPVLALIWLTRTIPVPRIKAGPNCLRLGVCAIGYALIFGLGFLVPSVSEIQRGAFNTELYVNTFGMVRAELLDFRCNVLGLGGNGKIETVKPLSGETTVSADGKGEEEDVAPSVPQVLNIDFKALAESDTDKTLRELDEYFAAETPSKTNKYTGMFKGYNLIEITAEGFSPYAIDEKLTPTLYKMQEEGFRFRNFYTPIWEVSTSDGEYAAVTGLIPKSGVWSFYRSGLGKVSFPFTMPQQFLRSGVKNVRGYHDHTYSYYHRDISHPNLGLIYKGRGNGLESKIQNRWPESDIELIEATAEEFLDGNEPFMTYFMSVSGHLEYSFDGNSMSKKNKELVDGLDRSDAIKAYIACNIEFDRAMELLLKKLEEAGVADHTVIAITPDHYPYGLEDKDSDNMYHYFDEAAGHPVETTFELYKSNFLLYCPGMKEPVDVDKYCSTLDIIPTLNNLFGFSYDSRLLPGRDILSDSAPLVLFMDRSWITDKGKYDAGTKQFTLFPGQTVENTEEYVDNVKKIVSNKFKVSARILETNYFRHATGMDVLYSEDQKK